MFFPVAISTLPQGGEITAQSPVSVDDPATHDEPRLLQRLGTSPVILWIDPLGPVGLEIMLSDYRPQKITLDSPKQHRVSVRLTPQN